MAVRRTAVFGVYASAWLFWHLGAMYNSTNLYFFHIALISVNLTISSNLAQISGYCLKYRKKLNRSVCR